MDFEFRENSERRKLEVGMTVSVKSNLPPQSIEAFLAEIGVALWLAQNTPRQEERAA